MDTKLKNITTQYRKFNENQALTEGQLNEFIDYFEDQDRLSRTRLSGVGIACGFKSTQTYTGSSSEMQAASAKVNNAIIADAFKAITITQGTGVTTDGDLITLRKKVANSATEVTIDFPSKSYTHYRVYEDNYNYPHFFKNSKQMPLLELLTLEEYTTLQSQSTIDTTLSTIDTISNLDSKIIILYLESYSNEETPCKDADCDNNGAEQVSNLKVLLADTNDVEDYVVNGNAKDSIYNLHNRYEVLYDALPNIEARRVILDQSITTAVQLKTRFQYAIQYTDSVSNTISDLSSGFTAIARTFNVSLNFGVSLNSKLNTILNTTVTNPDDYQYRYDLLKDLIDTYSEIKTLVLHLKAECCPSIVAFPKHLMLGAVGASLGLGNYTPYRHDFYNSPINTNDDENYERLILLANRFVEKIKGFRPFVGAIKITPSNKNVKLGEQAIPYYYNVTKNLLEKWNFEKTQIDKETYNLSYHTTNLASDGFVQKPLNYNIDDNDFYRIEGCLGLPYKTALQNINDIKAQYGLAFDVIALVLQKGKPTDSTSGSTSPSQSKESTTISIQALRDQLVAISSNISNQKGNSQDTLQTISNLDSQLRLLNAVEYTQSGNSGVSVLKQDPKKDDVVSELLSDFLERKSGLEHLAGVEPGGTFVLVYESETNNKVIADFALPYLCCSKKDPVFLVLPASELCQNDAPIAMTILPLDGEVKAYVNGNTQIPVITQIGGQNFFDPSLVINQYFEEVITFTVNDDPVDIQMVVHEQPSVSVTTGTITYTEDPTTPTADVDFSVSIPGSLTGLTYAWNFGDGSPIVTTNTLPANGIVSHTYNLVVGQEDTYNPTLTVTNGNGCSTLFAVAPVKLIGQTTAVCLADMDIIIQYSDNPNDPCGGGHGCDRASFILKGNGFVIGNVFLNNAGTAGLDHHNYPPGVTSGGSRYNILPSITTTLAQQIAGISPDGFITFSLECALPGGCHTGTAWTTMKLNGNTIYEGCPNNNFLTINPCTGETR